MFSTGLLSLTLLVPSDDVRPEDGATVYLPRANVEKLLREEPSVRERLDRLVAQAERGARTVLPRPARDPSDLLRLLRAGNRSVTSKPWIGEYRGWYFICDHQDNKPWLWFHSDAVRVGGREVYHFGSW
jgi:hypothetical protein